MNRGNGCAFAANRFAEIRPIRGFKALNSCESLSESKLNAILDGEATVA